MDLILHEFSPLNRSLLEKRDDIQSKIDDYHRAHPSGFDAGEYKNFLKEIGYLLPQPSNVNVKTTNVDDEIATIAGPQLVVPVDNARYALNAANARWGSLLDALYGTDAVDSTISKVGPNGESYNPTRGNAVFDFVFKFLNDSFPLAGGDGVSHAKSVGYKVESKSLVVLLDGGATAHLVAPSHFVGYKNGSDGSLSRYVVCVALYVYGCNPPFTVALSISNV